MKFIAVFVILVGFSVEAADQAATAFVLCKNKKTVRSIRITPGGEKHCRVTYTKGGTDELIGQARTLGGCQSILKNVQENLQESSWKCRDVKSAAVSYSSEITR